MRAGLLGFTLTGALIAVLGMARCAAGETPGRAEVLLEAATKKEVVDGDLKVAVAMYQKVVEAAGDNRVTAAKALVRMGRCYEKLGHSGARKTYQRVLREYPDQKEAVAEARARLAALRAQRERKHVSSSHNPGSPA